MNDIHNIDYYLNEDKWLSDPGWLLYGAGRRPLLYKLFKDGELIYIGKTCTGGRRIAEQHHLHGRDFNEVHYIEVPENIQGQMEKLLINHYRPIGNIQCNADYGKLPIKNKYTNKFWENDNEW